MSQITNNISLYKKIDQEMIEKSGVTFEELSFSYIDNQIEKKIELKEDLNGIFKVNEHDVDWSPSEHNLKVFGIINIVKPSVLFGEEGVTNSENKIGVAAHIHSRSSNFQKKVKLGSIVNKIESLQIHFEQNFPIGSIRGTVNLNFFMFLETIINESNSIQANKIGMLLSEENLLNLEIQVDGLGSVFPIGEFADAKGPLWDFNKYWQDPTLDSFDSSNVSLRLNTLHPLFPQIKSTKTNASRMLMNDIMVQAIVIIINEVLNVDKAELPNDDEVPSDTIIHAVKYWVKTFEVDVSNFISIMNSVRMNLESTLGESNKNDKLE